MSKIKLISIGLDEDQIGLINKCTDQRSYISKGLFETDVDLLNSNSELNENDILIFSNKFEYKKILIDIEKKFIHSNIIFISESLPSLSEQKLFNKRNVFFTTFPIKRIDFLSTLFHLVEPHDEKNVEEVISAKGYLPVKVSLIQKWVNFLPFDIYLKMSEEKYIKLISANTIDTKDIFKKYKEKGIENFYMMASDYQKMNDLLISGSPTDSKNPLDKIKFSNQYLQDIIRTTGVSKSALRITTNINNELYKSFKDSESKDEVVHDFLSKFSDDFTYNHSYLTAIICTFIANKLKWNTQSIISKLITASLLHDTGMENIENVVLHDLYPEKVQELDTDRKVDILFHSHNLADTLLQNPNFDKETIGIIRVSHENPRGTGYPSKLREKDLSSTMGVFLVSHAFVLEFYRHNFDYEKMPNIIEILSKNFNQGNFIKIIDVFKIVFIEERTTFDT